MAQGTDNQAQLIRWKESQTNAELYYSVWQDGTEIFNVNNIQTTHSGSTYHEFYVNIYGSGISPSPTVLYVDDV